MKKQFSEVKAMLNERLLYKSNRMVARHLINQKVIDFKSFH